MVRLNVQSPEQIAQPRVLYRTMEDVRIRTRSQIILLAIDGL